MRAESVVTTFLPSAFFAIGKIPEERPKLRPESLEDAVLNLLKDKALSKSELSQSLGHKYISGGLKKTLAYLLDKEKISYTVPEKPNSRLQKYKLNS